jgi:hypothetical protein
LNRAPKEKPMKLRIANTVLLFLLFAAFVYASPRQQDEPKSHEAKPEAQDQRPEEMKQEKNNQEKKDAKEQEKAQDKQEKKSEKSGKETGAMGNENQMHGKPAAKSAHIPDNKFHGSFGKNHPFHPGHPAIVSGQPTFAYGGYTFIMVDPWPADWAYTDDCYIDYVDGEYFLFDLLHPGVQVALIVSM